MNIRSYKILFYNFIFITLIKFGSCWFGSSSETLNSNGYIVFCPCMGEIIFLINNLFCNKEIIKLNRKI